MGIPTSVWFIIAAVALVIGLVLLRASAHPGGGGSRDRRRWAERREWEYLDSDPVLPSRWRYGTIHQGGPGVARNLVTGSVPTPDGRRLAYVFDHEQAGRLTTVICAVQRRGALNGAVEFRLPSAPLPDDAGLDMLEPVGQRYAFVTDAATVRPLLSHRLIRAADAIGEHVELLWAEESWVLATAPLDDTPDQLEDLLGQLVEVAGALDEAGGQGGSPGLPAPGWDDPEEPGPDGGSDSAAASWARSFTRRRDDPADDEAELEPRWRAADDDR